MYHLILAVTRLYIIHFSLKSMDNRFLSLPFRELKWLVLSRNTIYMFIRDINKPHKPVPIFPPKHNTTYYPSTCKIRPFQKQNEINATYFSTNTLIDWYFTGKIHAHNGEEINCVATTLFSSFFIYNIIGFSDPISTLFYFIFEDLYVSNVCF